MRRERIRDEEAVAILMPTIMEFAKAAAIDLKRAKPRAARREKMGRRAGGSEGSSKVVIKVGMQMHPKDDVPSPRGP
jgi:hypothetical protein